MSGMNLTVGGYVFPYIHQNNFGAPDPLTGASFSKAGDLERFTLYAGLIDLKTDTWRLVGELQGGWGEIEDFLGAGNTADISQPVTMGSAWRDFILAGL